MTGWMWWTPLPSEASTCGKETSTSLGWISEKFQVCARKIPASCQDWCELLLYSSEGTARVGRCPSTGGALCVALTLLAGAHVASHCVRRGQGGQQRRRRAERGE